MVGAPVLLGEGLDAPGVTPPASRVFDGLAVGALALAALLVYAHDLGGTPAYLHHDEIFFAVQADAIASNAHDTNGRLLPVYFQVYSNLWYQPLPVYFTALLLQALPISEASVRLPAAIVGAIDVVLLYLVARRLFTSRVLALVAAGLLALAPAHFIFSRLAIDPLYPVPFVLAWLLGLAVFFERSNPWMLFFATTSLGVGFYSYMASVVMMPMYLAITCGALWAVRDQRLTRCAVAIAGFAWPVVLSVPFHLAHPDFLTDQLARYGPAGATAALDPLQRISEFFNYTSFGTRVSAYFTFFNPAYLFLGGGSNPIASTRQAGIFLLPCAVFLPAGVYALLKRGPTAMEVLVLIGFATAPVAALIMAESGAIDRELPVLPFGALLAAFGVGHLWSAPIRRPLRALYTPPAVAAVALGAAYAAWTLAARGRLTHSTVPLVVVALGVYAIGRASDATRRWTTVVIVLGALALVQFRSFALDYFSDYRIRSASRFEGNVRGALEDVIAREAPLRTAPVYLSRNIPFVDSFWRFYTAKHRRRDLLAVAKNFDPSELDVATLAGGTLIVATANDRADQTLAQHSSLTAKRIPELDGSTWFVVLEKTPSSAPPRTDRKGVSGGGP